MRDKHDTKTFQLAMCAKERS